MATISDEKSHIYQCRYTHGHIEIDGRMDERAWSQAAVTPGFVDIRGADFAKPRYATRAYMLWNSEFLLVGASMDDPNVRATMLSRDEVVYHDNDFEVFIDPDGDARDYMEIEINAFNTVFDLLLDRPYRDSGKARFEWNINGLRSAVQIEGTLNDASDVDKGWSVEMAIPCAAICEYSHGPCPPRNGDIWRMNFARVQWPDDLPGGSPQLVRKGIEDNWVWSPQGEVDMHFPLRWGFVEFVKKARSNR